jgi:hypothetical protein
MRMYTFTEQLQKIRACGYMGVSIWETWPGKWMGQLIHPDGTPGENLEDYRPTPEDVLESLIDDAQSHPIDE